MQDNKENIETIHRSNGTDRKPVVQSEDLVEDEDEGMKSPDFKNIHNWRAGDLLQEYESDESIT